MDPKDPRPFVRGIQEVSYVSVSYAEPAADRLVQFRHMPAGTSIAVLMRSRNVHANLLTERNFPNIASSLFLQ